MEGAFVMRSLLRNLLLLALCAALLATATAQPQPQTQTQSQISTQPAAHRAPQWLASGVLYQVNPRSFSATGDFKGIEQRLDYLHDLGVTILWIMPIHPPGKMGRKGSLGSPYAAVDYYAIDPAYGTKDDFRRLIAEAHKRGLKVILDIVANHTAWDSVMMAHPDFYKHDAAGHIISPEPDWADVAALDYRNPRTRAYMKEMLRYWLRDFDLDGFRCDVAFYLPTDFWEEARPELEKIRPDLMMLAEANHPDLMRRAFDLDYDWPLEETLSNVIDHGALVSTLVERWRQDHQTHPAPMLQMHFSDNHDLLRLVARHGQPAALAASVLLFTLDGVPLLYNGMEIGDTAESAAPALFERLPIFWPMAERRPELLAIYRKLIALRRAHPALQQGETLWISDPPPVPNPHAESILCYTRRSGDEQFLVVINFSNQPWKGAIPTPGEYQDVTPRADNAPQPSNTLPALALGAWEFRIFQRIASQNPNAK
jgi:glycosidase